MVRCSPRHDILHFYPCRNFDSFRFGNTHLWFEFMYVVLSMLFRNHDIYSAFIVSSPCLGSSLSYRLRGASSAAASEFHRRHVRGRISTVFLGAHVIFAPLKNQNMGLMSWPCLSSRFGPRKITLRSLFVVDLCRRITLISCGSSFWVAHSPRPV